MDAEIISIGNELLIGDTVNTNASWLGQFLTGFGIDVTGISTVGDDLDNVKRAIKESMGRSDLVITTGGLGPTHDDVTKKALQQLFEAELVVDKEVLAFVKKMFKKRNIPFSRSNYHQAEVLDNCEVLFNKQGTAPGMWFRESDTCLAVLPGVPYEMKYLMKEKVLPKINDRMPEGRYRSARYLVTAGIGESTLSDDVIGELEEYLENGTSVAYLPSPSGTRIRVSSSGRSEERIREKIDPVVDYIYRKAGDLIIGEGKELSLNEVIGNLLRDRGLTVACAESCTGGLLANTLTDIPGSSDYMVGGVIAYADRIKIDELTVNKKTLDDRGAVSKEVALQMAKNVAQKYRCDLGLSTTGIAGPSGGTRQKPVGTVWIGYWSEQKHFALHTLLTNDRLINKERTVAIALETVRRVLLNMETMPYGLEPHWA